MIKAIRVDYRLLHGQVAVTWTSAIGADCILLVSDTVKDDPLRLEALKLAKPAGVKVVIKNTAESIEALQSGITDKYKLFVVCETIAIAKEILGATGFRSLNIGNVPFREDARQYGKSAFMMPEEEAMVKEMLDTGIDCFIQMVPTEKELKCKTLF